MSAILSTSLQCNLIKLIDFIKMYLITFNFKVRGRAMRFARLVVLPKTARTRDEVDGIYSDEYTCCPPPLFMITITLAMVRIFKTCKT